MAKGHFKLVSNLPILGKVLEHVVSLTLSMKEIMNFPLGQGAPQTRALHIYI